MLTLEIRKPRMIRWRTINGSHHNLLIPAHTCWYENGKKEWEAYYVNNNYHRDPTLGPAYIHWYENGQKYCEYYYVNSKSHRDPTLGPAHTSWYRNGQKNCEAYYVNGIRVSKPC